jgi:hypothetical protein
VHRGLNNHQVADLDIVTARSFLQSQRGPVIGSIFHQYARIPMGRTMHSSNQLEHYKLDVDEEHPMKVGGTQCITTPDGYAFPVDIIDGLAYLKCHTYTDEEFGSLPHVIMTSDIIWEPSTLDCTISSDNKWHNSVLDLGRSYSIPFDEFGRYKQRQGPPIPLPQASTNLRRATAKRDIYVHYIISSATSDHMNAVSPVITPQECDYQALRPFFLWTSPSLIEATYDNTTQYDRCAPNASHMLRDTYRSPFPASNVHQRHEAIATDTVSCNVVAFGRITCLQFFVGRSTLYSVFHDMHSSNAFVNTLEDEIRQCGTMDKLISDHASVEISNHIQDILRSLVNEDWQSKPHYQHQNYAEHQWQELKQEGGSPRHGLVQCTPGVLGPMLSLLLFYSQQNVFSQAQQ